MKVLKLPLQTVQLHLKLITLSWPSQRTRFPMTELSRCTRSQAKKYENSLLRLGRTIHIIPPGPAFSVRLVAKRPGGSGSCSPRPVFLVHRVLDVVHVALSRRNPSLNKCSSIKGESSCQAERHVVNVSHYL